MRIKLINLILLVIGLTIAGPNVSSPVFIDMDLDKAGIQSTVDLQDTGTVFVVAIVAQNVTNLMGCEFTLKIDTSKYQYISDSSGKAFDNSMPGIWADDSSWLKFTYARMAMTPQYLTASETQLGHVFLKNKVEFSGSAQIQVLSGKFASAGPEYDNFTTITNGTYTVSYPHYTISILTAPGGTINPASISVEYNTASGSITATPDGCHTFKSWELVSGNVTINSPTTATTTVTPQSNGQIRATYTTIQYTLTANGDGNGNVTGGGTYDCGVLSSVQATPKTGYVFSNWTVLSGVASFGSVNAASTSVTFSGNTVIQANFTPANYTLSIDDNGDGTIESTRPVQYGGSETITAATLPGKAFVNWTFTENCTIQNAASATATVTLTGTATCTAHFAPITYPLNIIASSNGTVSPSGIQNVNHGDSVQVIAQPVSGCAFVSWVITEGANNITIRTSTASTTWAIVTGPATIQANFEPVVAAHVFVSKTPQLFELSVSDATVQYAVPSGKQGRIEVKIMEMNGKLIAEHIANANVAGYFRFDLKNLRKGCYICTMKAGNFSKMAKVVLVQ